MPITKRNGVWYARVQVGNQRIERSLGVGATKEQAKELEASLRKRLLEDRHAKRVGKSLNRTFGEALLEYMKQPETMRLKSYQSLKSVANLIRPYLEDVPLEQTPEKAEEMKQVFLAEELNSATINRRLALVRRILRLAYFSWKWLTQPLTVTLLPEDNERHIYPEPDIAAELAATCTSKDDGDALLFIYFTGVRRGEFFRINRNPEAYIKDYVLALYSGNKTKRPGRILIAEGIRHIADRMPLKITKDSIRYHFEKGRALVGRPELRLHDFRHGFASLIIESGGDILDVKKLLRHTTIKTTERYTHLLDKRLHKIVRKADRVAAGKRRDKEQTETVSNDKELAIA